MNIISRITPNQLLYLCAILGSIALALWLNMNTLINNDGILYLAAAQAFIDSGLSGATSVYKWPFYSILIAILQQATHLSLEHAAFLLNTFLCILVVTGFITLVRVLGGNYQVQVCAAIIILLHTGLNDYREYIIRDFGHWAFMLYGLYFLILYAQNRQLRFALAYGCAVFIAFLFRTEAMFMMLAPVILLLPITPLTLRQRLGHTLGAYIIFIPLLALGAFCVELISANPWFKASDSADIIGMIQNKTVAFRQLIPHHVHDNQIIYFVLGGLLSYFFIRLLILLSIPYTLLVGYAFYKKTPGPSLARHLVTAFILIYLSIVLGFLSYKFFLAGRYMMPVVLLLSLWAPFGLSAIYDAWQTRKTWLFPLAIAALLYLLGDSIISTAPSQLYLKEAGLWLIDNTPENTDSFSNNRQVSYYAQNPIYGKDEDLLRILNNHEWQQYDYLIISSKNKDILIREQLATLPLQPMQVFANDRGDKVEIFKTR